MKELAEEIRRRRFGVKTSPKSPVVAIVREGDSLSLWNFSVLFGTQSAF